MSLKKNFVWLLLGRGVSTLCIFVSGMMINRALGPFYRGIFAEIQTWIGLFVILFGLSLDSVIYHYANREKYGPDDKARFAANTALTLVSAFIAVLCLTGFVLWRPQSFSQTAASHIILINFIIVLTMLTTNWTIFLQSLSRIKLSAIVLAVPSAVNLVLFFGAFRLQALDIDFALRMIVFIQGLGSLLLLYIFFKLDLLQLSFPLTIMADMVLSGLKQHGGTVAGFLYTKINQLILFRYCGEEKAGFFSVALTLAMSAMIIPMTLQNVLYPRVIHASDELAVTFKSLRMVFFGWGVVIMGMLFLAKPIIILYGGYHFLPAVSDFRILAVAFWFLALSSMLAPYLIKIGAFLFCTVSAVILGIFSIALNLYLIPRYATAGASMATLLTCFFGFCVSMIVVLYLKKKDLSRAKGVSA